MNEWILKIKECTKAYSRFLNNQVNLPIQAVQFVTSGSVLSVDERKLLKLGRSVLEFQLVQIQVDVFFYNIYHWCRRIVKVLDLLIAILWSIRVILNPWKLSFDEPPQFIEGVIIFRRKWVIRQQNWGISLFKKQALVPVRTHINYQRGGSCYNEGNF